MLRLNPGIHALSTPDEFWLRGEELPEDLDQKLRSIPGADRFHRAADGQLTLWDRHVPSERLPTGEWKPLRTFLCLELPVAQFAASTPMAVPVTLIRSDQACEPNMLLTTLEIWLKFAVNISNIRLRPLTFAASADGLVLVRGRPLPPLPGTRVVEREGIACPAGWSWTPNVDAATLRQRFLPESDDLALLNADGLWERIPSRAFVKATRSAVRETAESLRGIVNGDLEPTTGDGVT